MPNSIASSAVHRTEALLLITVHIFGVGVTGLLGGFRKSAAQRILTATSVNV
jgi:hypothetical protein